MKLDRKIAVEKRLKQMQSRTPLAHAYMNSRFVYSGVWVWMVVEKSSRQSVIKQLNCFGLGVLVSLLISSRRFFCYHVRESEHWMMNLKGEKGTKLMWNKKWNDKRFDDTTKTHSLARRHKVNKHLSIVTCIIHHRSIFIQLVCM